MTPASLRAAIASARERPRMYGDDPVDLESYLRGLVAGAYDGNRDVSEVWSALRDPPLRPGVYPDATFDSVCDHALRVVAALCPPPGAPDALDPDALVAEVRRLRAEVDEADARSGRFADLLRATADALKGAPQPLVLHSWHDLPEVAAALRAEVEHLRAVNDGLRGGAECLTQSQIRLAERAIEAEKLVATLRAEVERLRRLVDTSPPDDPEADAAAAGRWMRYVLTGELPTAAKLSDLYCLDAGDAALAVAIQRAHVATIAAGLVPNIRACVAAARPETPLLLVPSTSNT